MLKIGDRTFQSRLLLGTGTFSDVEVQRKAVETSETEILTFAVAKMDMDDSDDDLVTDLQPDTFSMLPNTAGANTAEEAVRIAKLARTSGLSDMVKVEVIGDDQTLLPDAVETYRATEMLLKEGFTTLPYIADDPVLARKLEELGAHAVMPGAAPIGTGRGILNPLHLSYIIEQANVPVIVDAGIGAPSHASLAMEMGADAVLLNRAVSQADDPVKMAEAMKLAIQAGRLSYEAGRIPVKRFAKASSPQEGV
ncbi:thiazole synthase [Salicibibacter halophilus]|uniref:Thiazole synthase n=1 Tax=Salicibibacter halophilus TaxID=2502791 RepID=A0A514LJ88_9BACI|nr:thiazole synthase [Salicibibacter halophilus]QDI91361.1 thiazole synthase [Salicibibacter halophilus]